MNDEPMGTYDVTLRVPVTVQQRYEYGNPAGWDWTTLVDLPQEITVKSCELLGGSA